MCHDETRPPFHLTQNFGLVLGAGFNYLRPLLSPLCSMLQMLQECSQLELALRVLVNSYGSCLQHVTANVMDPKISAQVGPRLRYMLPYLLYLLNYLIHADSPPPSRPFFLPIPTWSWATWLMIILLPLFFLALRRTRAEKVQRVTERLAQDHHVVPELHCCGSAQ